MRKSTDWRAIIALLASCLLLAIGIAGCGDDDGTPVKDAGQDCAVDAGMDAAAPTTDAGKDTGPAVDANICPNAVYQTTCGGKKCENIYDYATLVTGIAVFGYALPICYTSCCTDDDKCGASFGANTCYELHQTGVANATCPNEKYLGWADITGCCKPDGRCGVDAKDIGLGCVAREEVLFVVPGYEKKTCDYVVGDSGP